MVCDLQSNVCHFQSTFDYYTVPENCHQSPVLVLHEVPSTHSFECLNPKIALLLKVHFRCTNWNKVCSIRWVPWMIKGQKLFHKDSPICLGKLRTHCDKCLKGTERGIYQQFSWTVQSLTNVYNKWHIISKE